MAQYALTNSGQLFKLSREFYYLLMSSHSLNSITNNKKKNSKFEPPIPATLPLLKNPIINLLKYMCV